MDAMKFFIVALAATVTLSLAGPGRAQSPPAAAPEGRVAYVGELIDESGTAISGVFPLTFKLYETERAASSVWTERHFVAVRDGAYRVALGAASPVPAALAGRDMFIAVEVGTLGELVRQPLKIVFVERPRTRDEIVASLDLTYADVADRALIAADAERADDCTTLDGRSLADLDRYDEVLSQIAQLRDQLDGVQGARLGGRTTTLERAGGSGGNPYSRTCPPGHVVTGIRGGAGQLIDSIELICSPLQ